MENGSKMAPKSIPGIIKNPYFSQPCLKIDFWMHFGRPLAHFWHPLASKWLPLGSRWLPFGSLLAPFGSLLHPFGSLNKHPRIFLFSGNPFRKKPKNAKGRPIEDTPSFAPHPSKGPERNICLWQLRLIDPHRAFRHISACEVKGLGGARLEALLFSCLPDDCFYDDDLPIANLEPGVSGRNSLPLTGTPGS